MKELTTDLNLSSDNFPLDRYEPLGLLGRGGLGEVYLARDKMLGRTVAVKCLMRVNAEQVVMFQREAKIASRLHHANIVETLDFGVTGGGRPFISFEYFKGMSLESLLADRQRLDEDFVRRLFITVVGALSYVHSHDVLHRDLKPSNILLMDDGRNLDVRIIDFGVSAIKEDIQGKTLSQGKTIVGTPVYMSPDPVRGENFDARSEVYSIGCILFECLAGEPPFDAPTTAEVLQLHMLKEPPLVVDVCPDARISPEMQQIISKCILKEKSERFQSMQELLVALEAPISVASTLPQSDIVVLPKRAIRFRAGIVCGLIVCAVIVLALSMSIFSGSDSKNQIAERVSRDSEELAAPKKSLIPDVVTDIDGASGPANGVYISGTQGPVKLAQYAATGRKSDVVTLRNQRISSKMMQEISLLQPKDVQFLSCDFPSGEVVSAVSSLKFVRIMKFYACTGIAAGDLSSWRNLPRLKSLAIIGCKITDAHIAGLSKLTQIERLILDGNPDITLRGVKSLGVRAVTLHVWSNEGPVCSATQEQLDELKVSNNIMLRTKLDHYEGDGGDGLIQTEALELIE